MVSPCEVTRGAVGPIAQPRSLPRCRGVITSLGRDFIGLIRLAKGNVRCDTCARICYIYLFAMREAMWMTAGVPAVTGMLSVSIRKQFSCSWESISRRFNRAWRWYTSDTHASKRYGVFENGNEMNTVIMDAVLYQAQLESRATRSYGFPRFFPKLFELCLPKLAYSYISQRAEIALTLNVPPSWTGLTWNRERKFSLIKVLNCAIKNAAIRVMSYIFALQFRENLYFSHSSYVSSAAEKDTKMNSSEKYCTINCRRWIAHIFSPYLCTCEDNAST